MILGPDGKPATIRVRRAAGFTERELPDVLGDICSVPPPDRAAKRGGAGWSRTGGGDAWREEPFMEGDER